MRKLLVAAVGAQPAVAGQQQVEALDHVGLRGAGGQRERDVVEGAFHVVGRCQRCLAHPQHAEAPVVGEDRARADLVDVFRRQRHADDAQPLPAAVDDRAEAVTDLQVVGHGEGLARDDLVVAAGLHVAPGAQAQVVEHRPWPLGDGHQPAAGRLV